jgi:hypothetical protein
LPIPARSRKKDRLTINNSGCAAFDIRQARFQDRPKIEGTVIQAGETSAAFPIRRAAVDQPMPM